MFSSSESSSPLDIYFTDFFEVSTDTLDDYGAFNVSLINDLPLFVDPFLLFNSDKEEYQNLHEQMIRYLRFLRDKSASGDIDEGLIKAWFQFSEVKQNWLGFSQSGNSGSGLGSNFAHALNHNLATFFTNFGSEKVTEGSHLEKLTLVESGVGRDNISDFTTNLIKSYLLNYTEKFAATHIHPSFRKCVAINRVRFNYSTEVWENGTFDLPWDGEDYVILTPKDILTKDQNWIDSSGLMNEYDDIVESIPDFQLRAEINNYLSSRLEKDYNRKQEREARRSTIQRFPELIEYYIRYKEDRGYEAKAYSEQKVSESEQLYVKQVGSLASELLSSTEFYNRSGNTLEETRERVMFLKDVIENKGGHRLFYDKDKPIRRESDLQIFFRLTWFATPSDVSREVNDGRGPVDFKVSRGAFDKSLVEFKLASNNKLQRNLERQAEIYKAASGASHALKVILFFTDSEQARVNGILRELGLEKDHNVITIDGRAGNKPSGSKA